MRFNVSNNETVVNQKISFHGDDPRRHGGYYVRMSKIARIHGGKAGHRILYLSEWMERRGVRQVDIVNVLGVAKSNVSKWVSGEVMPRPAQLIALAGIFDLEEPAPLFRHPDDDWISRLFKERADLLRSATPEQAQQISDFAAYILSRKAG